MQKQPVPRDTSVPLCYGLEYQNKDRICQQCPYADKCAGLSAKWAQRTSLSEHLHKLEEELRPPSSAFESRCSDSEPDIRTLYALMYMKHFAKRASKKVLKSKHWARAFNEAGCFCDGHDIDLATWIAAQMVGVRTGWELGKKPATRKRTFQPNMLCGRKAEMRYTIYVKKIGRKYKQADGHTSDSDAPLGRMLNSLTAHDAAVGRYYVASRVSGHTVSYESAILEEPPSAEWHAIFNCIVEYKTLRARLLRNFGADFLDFMHDLVRARAVVEVAATYAPRLPDRLGLVGHLSFYGLADVLERLYSRRGLEKVKYDLEGIPGMMWR